MEKFEPPNMKEYESIYIFLNFVIKWITNVKSIRIYLVPAYDLLYELNTLEFRIL